MYEKVIIYPYDMASESARALKKALMAAKVPALLVYPDGKYVPKRRHLILNWGNSTVPTWDEVGEAPIKNDPQAVSAAVNKLVTFERLRNAGIRVPRFTTAPNQAIEMLRGGIDLVARTKLTGSEGYGAHYVGAPAKGQLTHFQVGYTNEGKVQLWTEYVPKYREFRVHVFLNNVIFTQEKKRRAGDVLAADHEDMKIRSHNRGWILTHNEIETVPAEIFQQSIASIRALGLDFGACDVVWNEKRDGAFLLEVNTAPGIEGATLEAYKEAILKEVA